MRTSQWRALYFIERMFATIQANITAVPSLVPVRAAPPRPASPATRMSSDDGRHTCAWGIHDHRRC
jgi:hypothetical protein